MIDDRIEGAADGGVVALTKRQRSRLRAVRERKGWGPKRLAEEVGVSRQYVWMIETGGHSSVRERVLDRIAASLGWPDFAALVASDELDPPTSGGDGHVPAGESEEMARATSVLAEERVRELAREEAQEFLRRVGGIPVQVRPDAEFSKAYYRVVANAGSGSGRQLVDSDEYVLVSKREAAGRDLFAALVTGSCMEPLLFEDDTVLCERVTSISQVPTGTMCVVTLLDEGEGDGGNVKYVEWASAKVRLKAEDNTRIVVARDRVKIEGRVIKIRRSV